MNHVDLTLVVFSFKNTYCVYCSVYIHMDILVQKTRHKKNSTFSLWTSTECIMCLQVFPCEFGLVLL